MQSLAVPNGDCICINCNCAESAIEFPVLKKPSKKSVILISDSDFIMLLYLLINSSESDASLKIETYKDRQHERLRFINIECDEDSKCDIDLTKRLEI